MLRAVDAAEEDRKLDDLAFLLRDYLATIEDIVAHVTPGDTARALKEIYRRAGLQQLH